MEDYKDFLNILTNIKSLNSKQAKKIMIDLIEQKEYNQNIFEEINKLYLKINFCKRCNKINLDEEFICNFCKNIDSKNKTLIIVKSHLDYFNIENIININNYDSFILNLKNHKDLISFLNFDKNFSKLQNLLEKNSSIKEIIFSFSHTNENRILTTFLKESFPNYKFFTLAKGLPSGNSIEFIDQETLKFAFEKKEKYE